MNDYAQTLQKHEAERIRTSVVSVKRVRLSYQLMLDFYGLRLTDAATGVD